MTFKTKWQARYDAGDLDNLVATKDIVELGMEGETYFYRGKIETLVIVEIDEDKKEITVKSKSHLTKKEKTLTQKILSHLNNGKHLLRLTDNEEEELQVLSNSQSSHAINLFDWLPDFSFYNSDDFSGKVLIKSELYIDRGNTIQNFCLLEVKRLPILVLLNKLVHNLVVDQKEITVEGIKFLTRYCYFLSGVEEATSFTHKSIYDALKLESAKPIFDRTITEKTLLGNKNLDFLMSTVTEQMVNKDKEEKEEEKEENLLDKVQNIISRAPKKEASLQEILDTKKIPPGRGKVDIDMPASFYPFIMKNIKNIWFNSGGIIINPKPNTTMKEVEAIKRILSDAGSITVYNEVK